MMEARRGTRSMQQTESDCQETRQEQQHGEASQEDKEAFDVGKFVDGHAQGHRGAGGRRGAGSAEKQFVQEWQWGKEKIAAAG